MQTKNLLNHESSRMEVFRVLSDCYFLPDPGLIEKLKNLEFNMANVCEPAFGFVQKMRKEIETDADLEAFKVEFSRLFVGPYEMPAAPYGSVYLEEGRKMMGDSTLDVRLRYRETGLNTAKTFKDAPDHISAELEFMYYLIFKEIEAFSKSDTETAIDFIQKQKSFQEDHLMFWVPQFTANIIENSGTSFYQNLARATKAFITDDYHMISSVLTSWQSN